MHDDDMTRISARVPEDLIAALDEIVRQKRLGNRSVALAIAIEEYVLKEKRNLCPECGHENEPGARYCAQCGRPLTRDAAEALEAAVAEARASPEYRALMRALKEDLKKE